MNTLKISLLGLPQVFHFDRQLSFHDRKALALLAYLAAEKGLHARQKLTRLLWPESDMAHGRTALRITLLHLRHILADDDTHSGQSQHLIISHDTLGLDLSSGVDLDLWNLESTWKLAHDLVPREGVRGELRRSLISQLQQAAALYRGSFLQDFTLRDTFDFDYWVGMQQGIWYQHIEQVFDWLSQLQQAEGALQQAIETIERWRSFDPLNEDIYLRLIQLHFAAGNRIAALKTYETCVEVLMKELSTRPSAQLTALAETLRSAPLPLSSHHDAGKIPANSPALIELPFVGRGIELSKLMALFEQACGGQPQVVVIEGEAGIGKTHLATAFLEWAKARGADVLAGKALRTSYGLPYQPLQDALGARFEQEPALRQFLSASWLAELTRLLPDLRERYPELPAPTHEKAFAAVRLFEAMARLTNALAAQKPLLLFIDNMQWIDDETLDALSYLCKRWTESSTSVLLLLSLRTETRSTEPRLAEWLANLKGTIPLSQLSLASLSMYDTSLAVHALTESSLNQEPFVQWLYSETQGQPFYMKAMLDLLLEHGLLIPQLAEGNSWIFDPQAAILDGSQPVSLLPAPLYELIQRRLSRLSNSARQLLVAGAVLHHNFSYDELSRVAQLPQQEGLAALDEVIEHLFLRESGDQPGKAGDVTYQFCYNKIREVIALEASDARWQVLSKRAIKQTLPFNHSL